jgi:nucleoid-associated protein YgaU
MADLAKVQQAVQGAASVAGVRNLNARQNGNMIEIHGEADSIAAKQNAIRAITEKVGDTGLSNLIKVSTSQQQQPHAQPSGGHSLGPQSSGGSSSRSHTVKKGETLSHIAQEYYGKASEYNRIFEANRDQLKDADKIREGMTLRIP